MAPRASSSRKADIPQAVLVEELIDAPSPADACARLLDLPYPLLLESSARDTALSRYSYLTADPSQVWTTHPAESADVLQQAADYLTSHRTDPIPGLPPFQGGVAGFLGYEYGRRLETPTSAERRRPQAPRRVARCLRLGDRVGSSDRKDLRDGLGPRLSAG